MINKDFYETLGDCIVEMAKRLEDDKAVLLDPEWRQGFDAVPYGETMKRNFAIESLKGKPTRKFFHISIYRLESGRYELTTYIL